jgi:hypothetical protein
MHRESEANHDIFILKKRFTAATAAEFLEPDLHLCGPVPSIPNGRHPVHHISSPCRALSPTPATERGRRSHRSWKRCSSSNIVGFMPEMHDLVCAVSHRSRSQAQVRVSAEPLRFLCNRNRIASCRAQLCGLTAPQPDAAMVHTALASSIAIYRSNLLPRQAVINHIPLTGDPRRT